MTGKGDLIAWITRKGFVWGPSPEIYGGSAGFYDYAPLGKLLKNRVEAVIRETFIKQGFWEMECPIVTPKAVWEASGHLSGFSDPLIKDEQGNVYRADDLIEEQLGKDDYELDGKTIKIDGASQEQLLRIIKQEKVTAPGGKKLIPEIKQHNLMMRTTTGLDQEAYNRPETATTTYLPFIRYLHHFRDKLPFGVFQIGKAFRNEISPRQHILRQREFTQAEAQLFLFKEQKNGYEPFDGVKDKKLPLLHHGKDGYEELDLTLKEAVKQEKLKNEAYAWTLALAYDLFRNMGIPENKIRLRQHEPEKMSFYADDAWDVEVELNSYGWFEVCGVHDRTDYDLTQHAKHAKQKLEARNEKTGKKEVPHVLEIAFGTDRPTYALMDLYYQYDEKKEQDTFTIPANMAPIQAAVFPLVNKEDLPSIAKNIQEELQAAGLVAVYDQSGTVGRRYARMDEVGTPYCVTVDFDTKKDGTVTVRNRDSTKQVRVKKDDLLPFLRDLFCAKRTI
ncbi:glycine--tRNA ligase [Candidatus Woesearchaeota archaeon]|nr:glycine--tRNA ligase [Candidatus Woesearchaeota archaeon]